MTPTIIQTLLQFCVGLTHLHQSTVLRLDIDRQLLQINCILLDLKTLCVLVVGLVGPRFLTDALNATSPAAGWSLFLWFTSSQLVFSISILYMLKSVNMMDVECVSVSDYATSFNDTHITSNTTGSAPGLFSQDFRLSGFMFEVF